MVTRAKFPFCTALAALLLCGGAASARTLGDELVYLIETHPQIKSRESAVSAARASIREAKAAWLPTVNLDADAGYNVIDSPARRAIASDALSGSREAAEMTVTENVFDGFGRYARKREAEANRDSAEIQLDATTQNLLFRGVAAYLDVLRQNGLLRIALANEDTIRRQLELEDERVRLGSGLSVDVLFAKSRLQRAKERRVQIQGNRRDAMTTFEQVFGRAPVEEEMVDPELSPERLPTDRDLATEIALAENPLLLDSSRQIDAAEERRRQAKADYYPTVDFVAAGRIEDDYDGTPGIRREIDIFMRANWEIFSGLATRSAVQRTGHERDARVQDEAFTRRQVIEDVRLSWTTLETVRERVDLLDNAVILASEVFEARKKLRAAGKETAVEVLDAENELNDARQKFVAADYDRRLSSYRVLLAVGRMTPGYLDLVRSPGAAAEETAAQQ